MKLRAARDPASVRATFVSVPFDCTTHQAMTASVALPSMRVMPSSSKRKSPPARRPVLKKKSLVSVVSVAVNQPMYPGTVVTEVSRLMRQGVAP